MGQCVHESMPIQQCFEVESWYFYQYVCKTKTEESRQKVDYIIQVVC